MAENTQFIDELEGLIIAMTDELLKGNHIVEIDSYIDNTFEEDTNDFHHFGDTKPIPDLHWHFTLERLLALT